MSKDDWLKASLPEEARRLYVEEILCYVCARMLPEDASARLASGLVRSSWGALSRVGCCRECTETPCSKCGTVGLNPDLEFDCLPPASVLAARVRCAGCRHIIVDHSFGPKRWEPYG